MRLIRSGILCCLVMSLAAGCAATPREAEHAPAAATEAIVDRLQQSLPDVGTARCLGQLVFAAGNVAKGHSSCGVRFTAKAETPTEAGLICVYSASPDAADTGIARGHFACSDARKGRVWFKAESAAAGIALAQIADGQLFRFSYSED